MRTGTAGSGRPDGPGGRAARGAGARPERHEAHVPNSGRAAFIADNVPQK
jgi:hypothetical protein